MKRLFFLLCGGMPFLCANAQFHQTGLEVPDSVKARTDALLHTFMRPGRFDSCITYLPEKSSGTSYVSEDHVPRIQYQVYYRFLIPGKEKAEFYVYFMVINGKITNAKDPFFGCANGQFNIIDWDKAFAIAKNKDAVTRDNEKDVSVSLRCNSDHCFSWDFSSYIKNGDEHAPSSSRYHRVKIDAFTGEVIPPAGGNN